MPLKRLLRTVPEPDAPKSEEAIEIAGFISDFEASGMGWFWQTNRDGTLAYLSSSVKHLLQEDFGVSTLSALVKSEDGGAACTERSISFYISSRIAFKDLVVRANAADEIWWSISGRPIHDEVGRYMGFRGIAYDLTDKRRSEVELTRLARYDALTGLANREMMRGVLEDALLSAKRRKCRCSLMLLDLDRFKAVNDTLGHPVGDALLRLVAVRLREALGPLGQVGRLGGDEFQAVLPDLSDRKELSKLADTIIRELSAPYYIEGQTISIGASVGIVITDYDDRSSADLVGDADIALYAAKAAGKGTYRFFEAEMRADAKERQVLEGELREALERGDLQVAFQPSVDIKTRKVAAFEALLRWNHPVRGPISPSVFVPLAEETGLIQALGEWVLRQACVEAAAWPGDVKVAVNLSPLQFQSRGLISAVASALANASLPANRLELEITEGVFLNDDASVHDMIRSLKRLGVRLALDDFGTGYSSLGYLRKVPFDKIKIDQSFVRGASIESSRNSTIIKAIVLLANEFGMETTAEGVETQDELAMVERLGCSLVQGYIFGKPMSAADACIRVTDKSDATPVGHNRARAPRKALIRSANLYINGAKHVVRLRNIAEGGALIESSQKLPVGSPVTLDIGLEDQIEAEVRWSVDHRYGLAFQTELDLSLLSTVPTTTTAGQQRAFIPTYLSQGG